MYVVYLTLSMRRYSMSARLAEFVTCLEDHKRTCLSEKIRRYIYVYIYTYVRTFHAHRTNLKRILSPVSRSVRRKDIYGLRPNFSPHHAPSLNFFLFSLSLSLALSAPFLSRRRHTLHNHLCSYFFLFAYTYFVFFFFNNTI